MFFALRIVTRDTPVIGRKPETAHISEQPRQRALIVDPKAHK